MTRTSGAGKTDPHFPESRIRLLFGSGRDAINDKWRGWWALPMKPNMTVRDHRWRRARPADTFGQ